ncbi:WD repeat-containing protein 44 isoform X2 [Chiloscyllium plagiosum]|uniref:WD repeat-containing protein 44 isoform X2 n=1 Tax=Chiloscyllium plagiosum TaxID=36176 RepID=UPI001CB82642|nr:WD repeat-containing protein 44 isoform X2 [Chiloscyllium plagiosum]
MASDTSDAEEFYDAAEDVQSVPSPAASPKKVITSAKVLEEPEEEYPPKSQLTVEPSDTSEEENIFKKDQVVVCASAEADLLSNISGLLTVDQPLCKKPKDLTEQSSSNVQTEQTNLSDTLPFSETVTAVSLSDGNETPSEFESSLCLDKCSEESFMSSQQEVDKAEDVKEIKKADILEHVSADCFPLHDVMSSEELQPSELPQQMNVEPDIVASTKKPTPMRPPPPASSVPPPRPPPPARPAPPPRKKKSETALDVHGSLGLEVPTDYVASSGLVSPNTAVENLAKELQHSLDLASATSGDKVVTAQENGKGAGESTSGIPETEIIGPQRPRSNSGRELTDEEILASVMVKNLDTGEEIPLNMAEEKLPKGLNPLTLHIMRRTKEYVSNDAAQSDDEEKIHSAQSEQDGHKIKQKTNQFKKFLGKSVKRAKHLAEEYGEKAVNKVKSVRDEVFHMDQDDASSSDDEGMPYTRPVKFKAAHGFKGPYDFDQIKVVQDLSGEHMGAVWTMKFSHCGRLLATAGQDNVVRIWVLKNAWDYFNNMRMKYNTEGRVSPSPSQESLNSSKSDTDTACSGTEESDPEDKNAPFRQHPFCKYKGHTADLLDLSWSKNYFLLSSSMDKTVRLWHISRRECLCCFQHIDFVTAIAFHPRDDRYFLSGSLDGKLRLWNIPDKKVALWNEIDGQTKLITAANFCQNGKYAVIGTYDGRCIFYDTEHLKYHTQIHVRSTRGRNRVGRKITGIEPLPGENKILVTSNDSRIRLYDLRDLSISMKYKGYVNSSSQIKASFSHDYTYIISGSEDRYLYIWSTYHDVSKFTSVRRDRNDFWEGIKAHNAVVTSAIFASNPSLMLSDAPQSEKTEGNSMSIDTDPIPSGALKSDITEVLLSADFTGAIKVFVCKKKN